MPTPENRKKIEYLSRYKKLGYRIKQLEDERDMWLSRVCKLSQHITDMPKAKGGSNSNQMDHYMEITETISQEIRDIHKTRKEIAGIINSIQDDILQTVMRYRYLSGMGFEQIAEEMHYSRKQICRFHGKALFLIKDVPQCPIEKC